MIVNRETPADRPIFGMTMSLDGFVWDASGRTGGLYADLADLQDTDFMRESVEETGAVVMGRRTFAMGDPDSYAGSYEFQVPIFVVTHRPPETMPRQDGNLTFTFVTDGVASAVAQAKVAAGDKAVTVVGGVDLGRQLLAEGLVDELRVDVMPVLLGDGLRLFDGYPTVSLTRLGVIEVGARTSLRFRVDR
jgi:dihydrofolate reductase